MQQARVSGPISVLLRLLFAVMFGFVVAVLSLSAGRAAETRAISETQQTTRRELVAVKNAIEIFYTEKHVLPLSLKQLNAASDNRLYVHTQGLVCDGWYQPLDYERQGIHYRVTSYGRDGKPGGTWLNADLTSDNLHPPDSGLSAVEFLQSSQTHNMVVNGCVSGLLAAVLCAFLIRPAAVSRDKLSGVTLRLLALLAATVLVGSIIMALHVPPSGH